MNKIIKYSLAAFISFGISSSCMATVITDTNSPDNGTNVGAIDTFIAEEAKAGNPTAEEDWVNSILDPGYSTDSSYVPLITFTVKTETVSYYLTNGTVNNSADPNDAVYAFELNSSGVADYFLIKNATKMALFQNSADINWGVFDTSYLTGDMNLPSSGFTISHVSQFNAPHNGSDVPNVVPEPGIVALFGMGLLGMGVSHIRRKRKAA